MEELAVAPPAFETPQEVPSQDATEAQIAAARAVIEHAMDDATAAAQDHHNAGGPENGTVSNQTFTEMENRIEAAASAAREAQASGDNASGGDASPEVSEAAPQSAAEVSTALGSFASHVTEAVTTAAEAIGKTFTGAASGENTAPAAAQPAPAAAPSPPPPAVVVAPPQ